MKSKKIIKNDKNDRTLETQEGITIENIDVDVIDCSITETENLKRRNSKNICKPKIKNFKNQEKIFHKNSSDYICDTSTSNNIGDTTNTQENYIFKIKSPLKSNSFSHTETTSENKKTKTPLTNTPDEICLSKSKLKNIQQWLQNNDFEFFLTPPFANLSITPVKFYKEEEILGKQNSFKNESSSLDSDVEGVLKAVYGDEWMQKYSSKKSKTEPKKCLNKNFLTLTEIKDKKGTIAKSVRRNIMTSYHKSITNHIDNFQTGFNKSFASGFKLINFNESKESLNSVNTNIHLDTVEKNHLKKKINLPSLNKNLENKKVFLNNTEISKPKKSTQKIFKNTVKYSKKTFLESLSSFDIVTECHPDAQYYKHNFKSKKNELIKVLFKLFNSEVFDEKLPNDMNFSWNVKLRGTAGYCYNKRITKSTGNVVRISRIEFSSKIIDRADRLRDTMIHELCHAASWVIEGKLDGHGPVWNSWATKAMNRFPELPLIKKCHNYDIVSKYLYRCTTCGYCIKRHSKSLDINKKRCGHCFGVFQIYFNKKKKGDTEIPEFNATTTLPTPNKFALFVKDNYQIIRKASKNAKHAEIMKILSQQYACAKNKTNSPFKY